MDSYLYGNLVYNESSQEQETPQKRHVAFLQWEKLKKNSKHFIPPALLTCHLSCHELY